MTSKEPTAMRAFFLVGVTARAVTRLGSGRALRRGCSSVGKTPLDVASLAGMHAGNAEGIEGGGAIIEKQNVRAGVFAVAGILGRRRPGFRALRVIPAGGIEPINTW